VGPAHQIDSLPREQVADTIYVVSHGWHAGIVFAPADTLRHLKLRERLPISTRYLEVGWGDAGYYPNPDPGLWALLRGGLWPTNSVLHLIALDLPVEKYFANREIVRLYLTHTQQKNLNRFLYEAFRLRDGGVPLYVTEGLYPASGFFEGRATYHLFHNCNHWVAEALEAAGFPMRPLFTLTRRQLMHQVRALGEVIQEAR
jgi:uncharacterized protein (TIGR02117 family)